MLVSRFDVCAITHTHGADDRGARLQCVCVADRTYRQKKIDVYL